MQNTVKKSGIGMLILTTHPDGLSEVEWQAMKQAKLRIKRPKSTAIIEVDAVIDKAAHTLMASIYVDVEGVWQVGGNFWFDGEEIPTTSCTTDKFLATEGFE